MSPTNVRLGLLAGVLLCTSAAASAQASILTNRYDNARTGANLSETQLNTFTVSVNNFGKLWSYGVDGAIFAQPLYVPGLTIGGGTHNVLYLATMNDKVYAFDADTNVPLWCVSFISDTSSGACPNPSNLLVASGTSPVPMDDILPKSDSTNYNIVGNIGIESTPVIDSSTKTMYLVARTKETSGTCALNFLLNNYYCQRVHAISIMDGTEKFGGPTTIAGSVPGIGTGSIGGFITFDPAIGNQRPGLALANGQIFIAWASHEDLTPNYHGWVMSYSASSLTRTGIFCVTPNSLDSSPTSHDGGKGGIWMWGRAPAVDSAGTVYFMSGNGEYDGVTEFGDSVIGFGSAGGLVYPKESFTPQNEETLDHDDIDLGSSGPMLIPRTNLLVGAGKSSILYVMDTTVPMDFGLEGLAPPPPLQDLYINDQIKGKIVKAGPVYWDRSGGLGPWIYLWPENDVAKAYHFNGSTFDDGGTVPATTISSGLVLAPTGNAGAVISLSANGSLPGSGILWASIPTEDGDVGIHPGKLYAFNADDLTKELWDSQQNGSRDSVGNWGKTVPPSVVNGKVYVPSFPSSATGPFPNTVAVYGLFDFSISAGPSSKTVIPGGSTSYTVSTASVYPSGFPSNVTLSGSGLSSGASASFSTNPAAVPETYTLNVAASKSTPPGTYKLIITGSGGIQTHSTNVTLVVSYNICLLYDPTMAKNSGSTFTIKIQICDASGNNLSASAITLQAQSVTMVSTSAPAPLNDSGDANPGFDFRYDPTLPGYIFDLSLNGVSTGTYNLNFTAGTDPVLHSARFQVK